MKWGWGVGRVGVEDDVVKRYFRYGGNEKCKQKLDFDMCSGEEVNRHNEEKKKMLERKK